MEGVYCVTSSSPVPSSDSSSPTVSIPKEGIRTRKGQARAEGSEITVTYAAVTASRSPTPQASLLLLLTEPESGVSIRWQCAQESSPLTPATGNKPGLAVTETYTFAGEELGVGREIRGGLWDLRRRLPSLTKSIVKRRPVSVLVLRVAQRAALGDDAPCYSSHETTVREKVKRIAVRGPNPNTNELATGTNAETTRLQNAGEGNDNMPYGLKHFGFQLLAAQSSAN